MLFLLKKIISSLILPPTGLILLAALGIWLIKKHFKLGQTLASLSLATLLALSLPVTGNALLKTLENSPPIDQAALQDIQAIVILGGGKNEHAQEFDGNDTVNQPTLQRLRYGAYLQQRTGKPILVTGGAPFGGQPEADTMVETLQRDFHAQPLWVENQSNDTAENAIFSAEILKGNGIKSIALVSQPSHLNRAVFLFERQGLVVTPAPTGFTANSQGLDLYLPSAHALENSSMAIKEWLGIAVAKATETSH